MKPQTPCPCCQDAKKISFRGITVPCSYCVRAIHPLQIPGSVEDLMGAVESGPMREKQIAVRIRRVQLRAAASIMGGYKLGSAEDDAANKLIKLATEVGL